MSKTAGIPAYRPHASGQARVTLKDAVTGKQKDFLLGKFGSPKSKAEYGRVIQQWEACGRRLQDTKAGDVTVNEVALAYRQFAEQYYRRVDGTLTNEITEVAQSSKPLKELYGHTLAREFGPMALKACRQWMIDRDLARPVINKRIIRIRRLFKWAVENELVSPLVLHGLQAVTGLQRGRSEARETEPVRPVAVAHVEQSLPFLPPRVAALVRLQLLTAARSGELVIMRTCDINTTGQIWIYTPSHHKTAHRGRCREIYIGPKAQEVLKPWLKADLQAFIFSPAEAEAARNAKKREGRKTKLWPSHVRQQEKRKLHRRTKRKIKDRYDTDSYKSAITRACDKAFPPPEHLAKRPDESQKQWKSRLPPEQSQELKVWCRRYRWHPHQLRHTAATLLRREFGVEVERKERVQR